MDEELKKAEDFLKNWLATENLELIYSIDFPVYRILPDEVKLALSVLTKHGMKIKATLKHKKQASE